MHEMSVNVFEQVERQCEVVLLPKELRDEASKLAIKINPRNALTASRRTTDDTKLTADVGRLWGTSGITLSVGFLEAQTLAFRNRVIAEMNVWARFCNVRFVENSNPEVRITTTGNRFASYIGTDILKVSQSDPTMWLGGFNMATSDAEFRRVVCHETGHTLGFQHEHCRREIVNDIDRARAIAFFAQPPNNWDANTTIANVLTPITNPTLETVAPDPLSIMCYNLPASIMRSNVSIPGGVDFSSSDRDLAARAYPIFRQISSVSKGKIFAIDDRQNIFSLNESGIGEQVTPGIGKLVDISAASDGTVYGVSSRQDIYCLANGAWHQVTPGVGKLVQISVGSATNVWGVNGNQDIYRLNFSTGNWEQVTPGVGKLEYVSVASDGTVYGVSNSQDIYRMQTGGTWQHVTPGVGKLIQISVGSSTNVWGVTGTQDIYRLNFGTGSWEQVTPGVGKLLQVSVASDGTVYGLAGNRAIYWFNPARGVWERVASH